MKPSPIIEKEARVKGGRASGGARYYSGKSRGEDKMVRIMQKALDEKKENQLVKEELILNSLSVDELISILGLSYAQTEKLLRETEKNVFRSRSRRVYL